MNAKCYKCGWVWNYRGQSTKYLTCPSCLYKLNVKKALGKLPNSKPKNPYKKIVKEKQKEFVGEKKIHLTNILHANPVNIEHIRNQK